MVAANPDGFGQNKLLLVRAVLLVLARDVALDHQRTFRDGREQVLAQDGGWPV